MYERRTFPLLPRRQSTRLPFGETPSRRRGHGSEVIGHRPYERGDPVSAIDWSASARASAASARDDFIVREHAMDEAPRVVLVLDLRPAMDLYPSPFPWLAKREALREAAAEIVASAAAARADIALLDYGGGDANWLPPSRFDRLPLVAERLSAASFDAPEDTLDRALAFLARHRTVLPAGTFVFVLSDFLLPPATWQPAVSFGWDVVPVVVQDPVWERSFPAVGRVALPVSDPRSGRVTVVRLSRREVVRRREQHERRFAQLATSFQSCGFAEVLLETSDPDDVDRAFLEWAEARRRTRWLR